MDWEGLLVIYIFCFGVWFVGLSNHRKCFSKDRNNIYLPVIVAPLFGKIGKNQLFDVRGIITQLSAYLISVIFTLDLGGFVSRAMTVRLLGLSGVVLLSIGLWFAFIRMR